MFTIESILKAYQRKGYKVADNDSKNYNLNILYIRNDDLSVVNAWNDFRAIFWKYRGQWNLLVQSVTTKPGLPCMLKPPVADGAFIVAPQQSVASYQRGVVHGIHPALVLTGKITGYRDNMRDGKFHLDESTLHTVGPESGVDQHGIWNAFQPSWRGSYPTVDVWSDACMVTENTDDHDIFMSLCDKAVLNWGNSFSYTLINESDLQL